MRLALAFWGPSEATDSEAAEDVARQAYEWAAAEPNVLACQVVVVTKPDPHRNLWEVRVDLTLRETEQTSWLVA